MGKNFSKHILNIDLLSLSGLCLLMLFFSWIGHGGGDDIAYIQAGLSWIKSFPFIGESHISLRHSVTLPLALSFKLFGVNELASIYPSILYYFALVILSYLVIHYITDRRTGLLSAVLIATTPLISVNGTVCDADIAEALFVFLSISFFYIGVRHKQVYWFFMLAGLFLALAWINRATSIGLGLFYLLLFIKGWGGKRSPYIWVAFVFLLLLALESLFYWNTTGDPLYRINTIRSTHIGQELGVGAPGTGNFLAESGNLIALKPFLVLLFNQEFTLLFWVAFPLLFIGLIKKETSHFTKDFFLYIAGISVVWFIFVSYLAPLRLLPRYYSVLVLTSCIAISLFVSSWHNKKRYFSICLIVLLLSFNALGIYVENKKPLFGERALVEILQKYNVPIHTDPITAIRATFLLNLNNDSVTTLPVKNLPKESLYFYNPNRFHEASNPTEFSDKYKPISSWKKLEEINQKKKWIGIMLEKLKLKQFIPPWIFKRLTYPNDTVYLYQVIEK